MKIKEFVLPSLSKDCFEIIKEGLKKQLKEAEESKSFIDVTGVRSIGKTTSLVEYAENNNYLCIVANEFQATCFKNKYNGIAISQTDDNLSYISEDLKCVIDEGVDYKKLKDKNNLNIVTGFYNRKLDKDAKNMSHDSIENFEKDLVDILKEEAKQLSKKIAQSRKLGNYGTYKNLILSLKEVLRLIQEYSNFTLIKI